jgi:hypothetical protein
MMLRLRLKNPVPDQLAHHAPFQHLRPEFPLKPRIERKTARPFQIVSLPQENGSFVASVVEARDPGLRPFAEDRGRQSRTEVHEEPGSARI